MTSPVIPKTHGGKGWPALLATLTTAALIACTSGTQTMDVATGPAGAAATTAGAQARSITEATEPGPTGTPDTTLTPEPTPVPTSIPTSIPAPTPPPKPSPTPSPEPTHTPTPKPTATTTPWSNPDLVAAMVTAELHPPRELNERERECLRQEIERIDPGATDAASPPPEALAGIMTCIPEVFSRAILSEFGLLPEDLSRDETACLNRWMAEINPSAFGDSDPAPKVAQDMLPCVPGAFIAVVLSETGHGPEDLSDEETDCIRRWVTDMDPAWFNDEDPPESELLALFQCAPHIFNP